MAKVISVFGSSRPRENDPEYLEARTLGRELARAGFVVCNGGYAGIMEASARGAKESGGATIGITVETFPRKPNKWIDTEISKPNLVQRLEDLVGTADGFVILKGGTGTLLELAYVWEFINKKLIRERPIVLCGEFWNGVVETLREELLWEGMGDCTSIIQRAASPAECAAFLRSKLL